MAGESKQAKLIAEIIELNKLQVESNREATFGGCDPPHFSVPIETEVFRIMTRPIFLYQSKLKFFASTVQFT